LLRLLGLPDDLMGEWPVSSLPSIRRRILKALNKEDERKLFLREPEIIPGGQVVDVVHEGNVAHIQRMGPTVIEHGTTDASIVQRLQQLDELLDYSIDNDFMVSFG
jgi:hypothetical protein